MTICDDCRSLATAFKPSIEDGNPFGEFFFVVELNKERVIVRLSNNRELCRGCIKERAVKILESGAILNSDTIPYHTIKESNGGWLGLKRK